MTREAFRDWPNKAVTLVGMSGVGKTTIAKRLPSDRWFHYSGDYRIGTKYLAEPILDNIKRQAMKVGFLRDLLRSDSIYIASNITVHNLEPVSTFLGKLGRADLGGLSLDEFKRRQRLHREAEIAAMRDVAEFIGKAREIYGYEHFLNDAGGSICELEDRDTFALLAKHTVIVYLRADSRMEETVIKRAIQYPKPLYFQEAFLDEQLPIYLAQAGLSSAGEIVPDDFSRWIFPRLVEHRRPRYEALAAEFGYTIDANDAGQLRDEQDFVALVASVLD